MCDESEQWAFFPDDQKVKDFSERLFSKDVDDMFLQYDIVYPSSDGFISNLQIHTAHVRAENAFVKPSASSGSFDLFTVNIPSGTVEQSGLLLNLSGQLPITHSGEIDLFTSGALLVPSSGELDLFTSGGLRVEDSLDLYTQASANASGQIDLYTSGRLPVEHSGILDLFVHGKQIVTSELTICLPCTNKSNK